jgi:preprotein translocase subunit YajC
MLISNAFAQEVGAAVAPSAGDAFWSKMGLIGLMFVLFYLLLIRPQQKRLKDQRALLDDLKKGDKVVTGGGLIGTVSKLISDTEVEVDLGASKVVALRYTIQTRMDDSAVVNTPKPAAVAEKKKIAPKAKAKPAAKKAVTKKAPAKKPTAKKTTTKKKA